MTRNVHELGGAPNLLEILANGPVRALRNWPAAMPLMRARLVECRPDVVGEDTYCVYSLSDHGRRKRAGFWGRFA